MPFVLDAGPREVNATKEAHSLGQLLEQLRSRPAPAASPGLAGVTRGMGRLAIAAACVAIALAMPPMELVPFTATVAGLALTAFGLALIAEDGVVALASFAITSAALAWVLVGLL